MDQLAKWNPTIFPKGLEKGTYMLHPGQQLVVSDPNSSSETPTHSFVKAPTKTLKINPLSETSTKTVQQTIHHSSNTTAGVLAAGGAIIADDATVIGVVDDPALILIGLAAIGTAIYDYANTYDEVIDVPITVPVDANATKITLYRGVSSTHPDYANAKMGMATPWGLNGGHGDPEAHTGGNTFSIFTSWSLSKQVANKYATQSGAGGVVLVKTFYILETVPSGEFFEEYEVLVPGVVTGATVTPAVPAKK